MLPLFVWATAAILFAAFAFFAFAQAALGRNGAQSAADAAALAAAQEERQQLAEGFVTALGQDGDWGRWLDGLGGDAVDLSPAAARLASSNDATLEGLERVDTAAGPGIHVRVVRTSGLGSNVAVAVQGKRARAEATATVKPLCATAGGKPEGGQVSLVCAKGERYSFDPEELDEAALPSPSELFSVQLTD
ncbi:pilus assembly protein TadG-related protein [Streptomyces sp. SPB074]|uniref:pilus assembly protein TadG-related protein n=1 Tax=Streptomyces sp. (strain SPB074) TaxID=465543 RepID=UPI0001D1DF42|nr:pilus assembly protein TadG-related protein [Streptomyces sp. SPB074]EFG64727.1 secreted protein [Streptomyces sp. SPB074]